MIYYVTLWYPSEHRGRAISRFYVAVPLSKMFMGAVAGALLGLQGRLGLTGWQWLFLIEGLPAVVMSGVILFCLPDNPATVRWLTQAEKAWLAQRMAADMNRAGSRKDHGVWQALLHPMVVAFTAVNFVILGSNYAFGLSAPELLSGATHLNATWVGYVVAAGGVLASVAMIFNGWNSDRTEERFLHLALPLALGAVAFAVLSLTASPVLVVVAYWAVMCAAAACNPVVWLAPSETISQDAMAVSLAVMNSVSITGGFVSPLLWGIERDATGSFRAGLMTLSVACFGAVALTLAMRRAARRAAASPQPPVAAPAVAG